MTILAEIYRDPVFFESSPGLVNRTQSDPGFVNPVRSGPGFVNPIRSGPGFVNAHNYMSTIELTVILVRELD